MTRDLLSCGVIESNPGPDDDHTLTMEERVQDILAKQNLIINEPAGIKTRQQTFVNKFDKLAKMLNKLRSQLKKQKSLVIR